MEDMYKKVKFANKENNPKEEKDKYSGIKGIKRKTTKKRPIFKENEEIEILRHKYTITNHLKLLVIWKNSEYKKWVSSDLVLTKPEALKKYMAFVEHLAPSAYRTIILRFPRIAETIQGQNQNTDG